MLDKYERLLQAAAFIDDAVESSKGSFLISTREERLADMVVWQFCELRTIFLLMAKDIVAMNELSRSLRERVNRGLAWSCPDSNRNASAEFSIHLKAAYEWIYQLNELLKSEQTLASSISSTSRMKLRIHCDFRNKLITHKQNQEIGSPMRGTRIEEGSAALLLTGWDAPALGGVELDTLWEASKNSLPINERTEINFYLRVEVLRRHFDLLPDRAKGQLVSFIEKYGVTSDEPFVLAEDVARLANEVI